MTRISTAQYSAIRNRRRLSKEDQERLAKWLEPIEDEDTVQMRVVAYLELLKQETGQIVKFTAIPNNTFSGTYIEGQKYKSQKQAAKQVKLGLRKGLCDLLIIYKKPELDYWFWHESRRILFLELKREKGGTLSPEQKNWIHELDRCIWVEARVAKGFKEAKEIIDKLII